jgi:putative tricarboxylic transport membrane protein
MTPENRHAETATRRRARPELLIASGAFVVALVIFWQAWSIPASPVYATIGPSVFPIITATGLGVLALGLLIEAWTGGWQSEEEKHVPIDRRALALIIAGLIANVALIDALGFTLASTVMFVLVARGFGSNRPLRDAAIGFALALVAYLGFAKALGVNIGAGYVERLLGG